MCVRVCLRSSLEEEQERAKKELNLGVPEATNEVVAELRRLRRNSEKRRDKGQGFGIEKTKCESKR